VTVVLESIDDFNLESLRRVAWDGEPVAFGDNALARMRKAREDFLSLLEREPDLHIYGVTTGYGDAARTVVGPEERERLARNPIVVIGAGVGEPLPDRVVRAMIFTRLINYVSGYTGLSLETAQQVADMLDGRPLPTIRREGQDSQGELLQLINLFSGLDRERFQPRDANAITNGTGCTPGLIGDVALRARRRTAIVARAFALSIDTGSMMLDPYDPALKEMMGDEAEWEAIDVLSGLLAGDELEGRREFQNPISWRILARMLGQVFRAVGAAEAAARSALSRVNDNPVFLPPEAAPPNGRILSTGGFHNPAAYHAMNGLSAIWADMCVLAAKEAEKLHYHEVTGLPQNLAPEGRRSGTRLLTVTAFDLANRARELASPALIPLYAAGDTQTDTVMPIFLAFEKEAGAARCLDVCLAILSVVASQALHLAGREPALPLRAFLSDVRERFAPVESPRDLGAEVQALADFFDAAVLGLPAFGLS
jgi:histidine ammonia-lyase